jgi:hypothetical protein
VTDHLTVTPPEPDRTARNLTVVAALSLEDALIQGISDPGSFLPRRMSVNLEGDREYEPLRLWQARACELIVTDRFDR